MLVASALDAVGKGMWTARPGNFEILAAVDPKRIIAETIESNNKTKATLTLPDGKVLPVR